jgi:arogenate dehydrogenase (NADP+)
VATPTATTDPEALAAVQALAEAVDAEWLQCEAGAHDRAVALISHMPVLVSAALLQAADHGGDEAGATALVRRLASSGFADTSRIGGGNPELGALMARCNRPAVLQALAQYRQQLTHLEELVETERWDVLQAELGACQALRPDFL